MASRISRAVDDIKVTSSTARSSSPSSRRRFMTAFARRPSRAPPPHLAGRRRRGRLHLRRHLARLATAAFRRGAAPSASPTRTPAGIFGDYTTTRRRPRRPPPSRTSPRPTAGPRAQAPLPRHARDRGHPRPARSDQQFGPSAGSRRGAPGRLPRRACARWGVSTDEAARSP